MRRAVLLSAAVLLVVAMILVSAGALPGWWLLINAAIVAAAVLFERRGYHPVAHNPSALRPTGERFRDPTTNELVEVWQDPHTGEREYRTPRAEPEAPA